MVHVRIIIGVILVAHSNFDLLEATKHVVLSQQFILNMIENRQHQLVEKLPFVFEKLFEEGGGYT